MAYVNISMGLTSQGEVLNSSYWTSAPEDGVYLWAQFADGNISPTRGTLDLTSLQFGDTTNGLILDSLNNLRLYYNGVESAYYGLQVSDYGTEYIMFFGIDEENQRGSFWLAQRRQVDRWGYTIAGGRAIAGQNTNKFYNTLDGYNWIKAIVPPTPTINWQSVQSITGNGLTIPLVTLKSDAINGGEPVSNGTINSFTNQPSNDNNVKYLVDLSISVASNDITVDYTIPTITKGSYISVKLFGKIGELPACNEDDDVIEDLDPIESSKDIYSLPGGMYYFCIRTITSDGLKLTSNALSITIADPVPEDLKPYVKLINDITGYTYDGMGGFTMYDYTIGSDGTNPNYDPYCRNYSWRNQHWAGPGQSEPVITNSNFDTATILPHSIMDVNVDTSTFTITSNTVASPMIFSTRYQQYGHRYYQGSYFYSYPCSSNSINVGTYSSTIGTQGYNSGDTSVSFSSQYLTTTFDCVKWVAQNFRNINLYVDGVLWSKANNTN